MSDLFWLSEAQMERLKPFCPMSHGKPRVNDRRVLSGIILINRNGLSWLDAPAAYGPPKALYNPWVRWNRLGGCARVLMELAAEGRERDTLMIDASHPLPGSWLFTNHERVKAHRTAASLRAKKGGPAALSGAARAG